MLSLPVARPQSVGVLAQLAGARQPQTTKHLQTLERAGIVTSHRSGQRRIHALRSEPLRELAAELVRLADEAGQGPRTTFDQYEISMQAERLAAQEQGWADGRSFTFRRALAGDPETVWRCLTEPDLLARWWTPDDMRVSGLVFEARPDGRIVLEYRDAGDDGSAEVTGRAVGTVAEARPGERLTYRLRPLLPDGGAAFTAHVTIDLRSAGTGCHLDVGYRVADSAIEIGFGQSLDKPAAIVAEEITEPRSTV